MAKTVSLFIGGTYEAQSLNTDAQRCVNWYPEPSASGDAKSPMSGYPTAGTEVFCTLPEQTLPALFEINGRGFAAASQLYEIFSNRTFISRGSLATFANSASMSANQTQLLITTGGRAFVYGLDDGSFVEATGLQGPVSRARYIDGVFIAFFQDTNKFQISQLEDGTTWDPADVFEIEVFPENIVSMEVDHEQVCFFGQKHSAIYFDSGDVLNPYQPVPGGFIEQGCAAAQSVAKLDNTYFWIGRDQNGQGIAWRMNGYTPQRISNFAIENEWADYDTLSDAIGYAFQERGHTFYQIYFPSANKTWVYDAATGYWHERAYFFNGSYSAHRSQCHMLAFGKHLAGDWATGNIYEMSQDFGDDAGQVIRRFRRSPHISEEQTWMFHEQLQIDLEVGLGPMPALKDGFGHDRPPIAIVRWSDDAARTWSNEHEAGTGQAGEYFKRVMFRRLGRSRDRIYEVAVSDPVPWRITNAYLQVSQ
jgi:hypothetical protein